MGNLGLGKGEVTVCLKHSPKHSLTCVHNENMELMEIQKSWDSVGEVQMSQDEAET